MTTRFRVGLGLGLGLAVGGLSSQALAQTAAASGAKAPAAQVAPAKAAPAPAPANPAPANAPPAARAPAAPAPAAAGPVTVAASDVVRLRNGGILRGTISELVPGDYVSIVLITGETRKVAYADVQYAGAANEAPAAPPPAAPALPAAAAATPATASVAPASNDKSTQAQPFAVVHAKESQVSVSSKQEGITLFRRAASAGVSGVGLVSGYDEVCTAPCNVSMPAGTHTFAVAKPGGKPREADPVMLPAGNTNMQITYIDRTAMRVGLGLVGIGALVAGFALALSDSGGDDPGSSSIVGPILLGGAGAGLAAIGFSLPDGSKVTITQGAGSPSNNPVLGGSRWHDQRPRDVGALRNGLSGLTVTAHF